MQRSELHIFLLFFILSWHLVSCSSNAEHSSESEYNVQLSLATDSTVVADSMYIFIDNHQDISVDTLLLSENRSATYTGTTEGIDELFLLSHNGIELCHFYAIAGGNVDINISGKADSLVIDYTSPSDTINSWLQNLKTATDSTITLSDLAHKTLDSLRNCGETELRTTLLLRDLMPDLRDSIYVRRYLGGIPNDAKPEWLIKSIDHQYPQLRSTSDKGRLTAAQFQMQDTLIAINTSSRSDYMLLYFWADYSQQSVDSLKALTKRIKKKYSDKRLMLLTFCISAPDSTWWNNQVDSLDFGHHTLLPGGFADHRIADWAIDKVPYTLITDMFTNIQNRDIWDEELTKALTRIPKRTIIYNNSSKTTTIKQKKK